MQIGIFAKTFAGPLPAVMAKSAAAGYDGIQYNMACSDLAAMPDAISNPEAHAVGQAAALAKLSVFAVSGTYNMIHPDPKVRATGHRRLAVLAAAAAGMTTRLITLCTGSRDLVDQWAHHADNASPKAWRDLLASFEIAVGIAEAHDVWLGVEPELANVVNSAATARRLITDLQSDRIRIVLDPANLFERASPDAQRGLVDQAIDLLADRIIMAHAKDRNAAGGFATPGKGVIDFDHFLASLHRAGFAGPVVTHGLHADEAADVAAFLRAKLRVLGL